MFAARSLAGRAKPATTAWLLVLGMLATPWAIAQDKLGLKLTIEPANFALFPPPAPAPQPQLDLTVHWKGLPTHSGTASLIAGRPFTFGKNPHAMPGLVPPDPEARSPGDLLYVGMQFEDGTRIRLKRSGDGLKLSYRSTF